MKTSQWNSPSYQLPLECFPGSGRESVESHEFALNSSPEAMATRGNITKMTLGTLTNISHPRPEGPSDTQHLLLTPLIIGRIYPISMYSPTEIYSPNWFLMDWETATRHETIMNIIMILCILYHFSAIARYQSMNDSVYKGVGNAFYDFRNVISTRNIKVGEHRESTSKINYNINDFQLI